MHLLFAVLLLAHWLLASDLHVEPGHSGPVPATYGSDTNWALFDSALAAMRRADPNPPVVIIAGDFLAHHFPPSAALGEQTMARIAHAFDHAFPHAQFVIVPGNNDDPCGDYRATPGDAYFRYVAHVWAPLVNRNGAAPQFERTFGQYGWYAARLPLHDERVIALDTVYYSIVYRACSGGHPDAPQRQLRWLATQLRTLPAGTRAMLVMHIPPGVDAKSTLITHRLLVVPFWREQTAAAFVRVLRKYDARITLAIAGHEHRNDFRSFGGVPMLVAPAVSPVYDNNPSFAQLDVGNNGDLRDYTLFSYDEMDGGWERVDTFDRVYRASGFSARSLASIHARLRDDESLRRKWAQFYMARSVGSDITLGTWRTYWCAQTQFGPGFVPCAGLQRRVEVLPIAAGVAAAVLIAVIALLAVRLGRARRRT
ncbi:MAG TPA: metallophosphoesterase [Candidatus Baltobacteraceae bacterium]|nr:metallophosphoesterase [Candidatus Baltobacteraceae bacterium]